MPSTSSSSGRIDDDFPFMIHADVFVCRMLLANTRETQAKQTKNDRSKSRVAVANFPNSITIALAGLVRPLVCNTQL